MPDADGDGDIDADADRDIDADGDSGACPTVPCDAPGADGCCGTGVCYPGDLCWDCCASTCCGELGWCYTGEWGSWECL